MRRAIITLLVLLSFGLKAQVYQAMPQAGYGPVKRMLFDSVLTIPLNINQLRNITGGRDAGQIRYNVSDSGLYVFTGYTWIKANLDSVNLSNRINGKLNISDTAYMLSWYMRKTDTLSLSNRINLRVKYTDTAAMLDPYLRKLDTASLSRRIDEKQNIIKLTTNFKSGAATLIRDTLNIPKYSDTLQDNYVPYVGAIKDVDLGAYKLNANTLTADYLLQAKNSPYSITPTSDYTSITPDKTSLVLYTSWMQGSTTYTQSNRFNYANQAQQNNTREYNLPVRNGTLALVEDTVNLSNRINLKADKATVLTINGVGYNLSANRTWTIPTFDSTSISNRINLKLNISDTASMLSPYLRKADTSSLSNRINLKTDKSTTLTINGTSYDLSANRSWTIPTVDTTSLSNRINLRVKYSDTAAMLSPYLRKVDTTNAFLTSVSQPNDSTLSFVKGSTLSSYIIRASTQGSATKLITNVYNNSGAPILKGSVVYINGAHSSNLPTIALALASNEATSAFTYGVVENDIPNNTAGVVVQNGVVTGLNLPTATYTDGQTLYLSPTVAGGYTLTKVIAPNHYVAVGTVTRAHPTFGTIQVAIRNGFQLDELSDVLIAAIPLDSTVLQFSRVDSLWHDVSITSAIGSKYIKPTDTTSLSNRINAKADALSGTTNTVPKFTSSTTIGNSNIKDNGSAVTINATAGSFGALQVGSYNGNILMNTTNSNGGLIFQNTSSSNKLWDFSSDNNDLVFNESNIAPVMKLKAGGNVVISNLSGTGSRMVVADANGVLSTQAITGVDTTSLSNRINLKLNISDTASMLSPYLRKADTSSLSNRINTKQNIITLTTTGTSGAATFISNTLNIPQYQAAGTYVTSVTGTSPIVSSGGTTPAISIPAASSSVNGYLSSTDWSTFNNKGSGSVTSVATGLGLSGGTITTSGTLLVDTASASILSRQRAANTYYLASNPNGYTSNTGTVTSVAALTLGTSGTDLSSTVANGTTTPVITLNVPTASATNRGALSSADWTTFNNKVSTATLSGYLPLTGGTLTGALGGTTASFSSSINATTDGTTAFVANTSSAIFNGGYSIKLNGSEKARHGFNTDLGAYLYSPTFAGYTITSDLKDWFKIASTGAATFSSSVTANSFTMPSTGAAGSTTWNLYHDQYVAGDFSIWAGSTSRLLINASGNVGIGTTSPLSPLHQVAGGGAYTGEARFGGSTTDFGLLLNYTQSGATSASIYSSPNYSNSSQTFKLGAGSGNTNQLVLTGGGNVLIGTTTDNGTGKLQINGAVTIGNFASAADATLNFATNASGGARSIIYRGATALLDFTNTAGSILFQLSNGGAATFSSLGTGTVYSNGGTLTNTNPSDSSLKNSISPLSYGLSEILKLEPKTFYYNSDSTKASLKYGFIAQDVQPIMPDLVRTIGNRSDKLGLESDGIYVTMVNAIKELSAQIKDLQTEIQTLKNK